VTRIPNCLHDYADEANIRYSAIDFERCTPDEQARLIHDAKHIVGVEADAMPHPQVVLRTLRRFLDKMSPGANSASGL